MTPEAGAASQARPAAVLQDIHAYAEVGVTHLIFDFRSPHHAETEERMARFSEEVMAA